MTDAVCVPTQEYAAPVSSRVGSGGRPMSVTVQAGETVVCVLPGHESEVDEFHCDRELVQIAGRWVVQAVSAIEN